MRKGFIFFLVSVGLLLPIDNLFAQGECGGCLSGPPFSPPPASLRVGVLLVQFSDWATNTDARGGVCQIHPFPENLDDYTYQMYYDHFFSTNYRTATYGKKTHDLEDLFGSMKEFYQEMSYNKFTFAANSDIINPHPNPNQPPTWVTLTQTKSYWQSQGFNPDALLAAALAASGYSTSGYDKVILIYAGNETGGGLTPSARVSGFVYQVGEKTPLQRGRTQTIGTFYGVGTHCHEFGHLLGLDDQKKPEIRMGGLGNFELMAVGNQGFMNGYYLNPLGGFHAPTPLSGWSRLKLGWATYEAINADGPLTFPSLDETDRVCVRFINDSNPSDWDEGEFFIIENRRPQFTNSNRTFDGDMMNGLVIWHRGNLDFSHNGLKFDVEEANGLDEVGTYIGSSRNDHLFPGTAGNYTAFTPYTNPNSNKQDGTRSGFALTCIKVNGSGASAYVTANAYLNFYTGTWSGNVTTNTAWGGTVTVTTNVTVNSGVTLTIDPGSVIQFQSGTSLTVNGKLIADSNDPAKRITFTGTTATPGFWNGITINSGSSTNVSTLRRCDVQYATDGIAITYTGNSNNVTIDKCKVRNNSSFGLYMAGNGSGATVHPTISNNTIANNNNSGIYLTNYAKPTITVNRIENNGYAGIEGTSNNSATVTYNYIAGNLDFGVRFSYSSFVELHRNTIKANYGNGIYCFSNSNLNANGANTDTTKGRNEIANNSGVGIYASSASPNFGQDVTSQYGNNWIHDNTSYEAQQVGSGYQFSAKRCYWSGQQTNVSGNVATTPVLSSQPSPVGWGKVTGYDPTLRIWRGDEDNKDSLAVLLPLADISSVRQKSATPLQVSMSTGVVNWSGDLQAAIDTGRKTGDWSAANELITNLHRELQNARTPTVDFTLVNSYANDLTVTAFIRKMLALALMEKDLVDNKDAAALAKSTAFAQPNRDNAAELLAHAGLIQLYRQNNLTVAQNVLSQIQAMAQNGDANAEEVANSFGRILNNHRRHTPIAGSGLEKSSVSAAAASTLPATRRLTQNYPNPFNPETIIRFYMNERQKVRLAIYDLAGHRVRTLVDGELAAGDQIISWDGRDQQGRSMASGVYFYELAAGNQIERKKMTLVR